MSSGAAAGDLLRAPSANTLRYFWGRPGALVNGSVQASGGKPVKPVDNKQRVKDEMWLNREISKGQDIVDRSNQKATTPGVRALESCPPPTRLHPQFLLSGYLAVRNTGDWSRKWTLRYCLLTTHHLYIFKRAPPALSGFDAAAGAEDASGLTPGAPGSAAAASSSAAAASSNSNNSNGGVAGTPMRLRVPSSSLNSPLQPSSPTSTFSAAASPSAAAVPGSCAAAAALSGAASPSVASPYAPSTNRAPSSAVATSLGFAPRALPFSPTTAPIAYTSPPAYPNLAADPASELFGEYRDRVPVDDRLAVIDVTASGAAEPLVFQLSHPDKHMTLFRAVNARQCGLWTSVLRTAALMTSHVFAGQPLSRPLDHAAPVCAPAALTALAAASGYAQPAPGPAGAGSAASGAATSSSSASGAPAPAAAAVAPLVGYPVLPWPSQWPASWLTSNASWFPQVRPIVNVDILFIFFFCFTFCI